VDLSGLNQFVTWINERVDGLEKILKMIEPTLHAIRGDVAIERGSPYSMMQRAPIDPSRRRAWAQLPTIPHTVGEPPLIAPTPPFRDSLAGAAPAPIALAPLTHGHGLDAPTGLARGLARPVEVGADRVAAAAPALSPARHRLQRKLARASDGGISEGSTLAAESLGNVLGSSAPGPNAPDPVMVRQRAAVIDQPGLAPRSFVSAAGQSSLPLPPGGRIAPPHPARAAARTAALPASAPGPAAALIQRAPASSPIVASLTTQLTRSAPTSDRLTLGQSRRLGLGAPIDPVVLRQARTYPVSDGAPSANATIEPSMPLAATRPSPQADGEDLPQPPAAPSLPARKDEAPQSSVASHRLDVSVGSGPASLPSAQGAGRAPAPSRSAPRSSAAAMALVHSEQDPSLARPSVQRAPRAEAAASVAPRPLIGARPIGPAIQRAPSAGAASQVRIRRGSEANELAGALDARAFTHAGEIYLPDSHGPLSGPKAQSLLAHEMTHVAQQRRLGSGVPAEDSAHGQQLEAQAVAAERAGQLPLASPPDRTPEPPLPAKQSSLPASFELASGTTPAASSPPPAQRASEAKFTDPDDAFRARLDSNEEYLFGRLERRLRRQLISERERGGTLIDAL